MASAMVALSWNEACAEDAPDCRHLTLRSRWMIAVENLSSGH